MSASRAYVSSAAALPTHILVSLLEAPPATLATRSWRSSPLSSSSCLVKSALDLEVSSCALTFAIVDDEDDGVMVRGGGVGFRECVVETSEADGCGCVASGLPALAASGLAALPCPSASPRPEGGRAATVENLQRHPWLVARGESASPASGSEAAPGDPSAAPVASLTHTNPSTVYLLPASTYLPSHHHIHIMESSKTPVKLAAVSIHTSQAHL